MSLGLGELLVLFVLGAIYFFPSIVGRSKTNFVAIFVLNLFLGWTVLGWVAALVWALTKDKA
ncbi:MAG: superinfection immunity protein [Candidatus Marinimicrobia bacterium]|nr:superinfection immunity protein [Candidatus Neomarinimicrobiota bacterium]